MSNALENILKVGKDIFVGWMFSTSGIAVLSVIGGVIMIVLTYFTQSLSAYAPLSIWLSWCFWNYCAVDNIKNLIIFW